MKIRDLLRADSLPPVDERKRNGGKARESEFDLITVLARQIRRLRKSERSAGASGTSATDAANLSDKQAATGCEAA